jgi:hypothetical protein
MNWKARTYKKEKEMRYLEGQVKRKEGGNGQRAKRRVRNTEERREIILHQIWRAMLSNHHAKQFLHFQRKFSAGESY